MVIGMPLIPRRQPSPRRPPPICSGAGNSGSIADIFTVGPMRRDSGQAGSCPPGRLRTSAHDFESLIRMPTVVLSFLLYYHESVIRWQEH